MAQGRDGGKKSAHSQKTVPQLRKTLVQGCGGLPGNIPDRRKYMGFLRRRVTVRKQ